MLKRHLQDLILGSLQNFPVVLVTGARQVGKSTLVQNLSKNSWKASYLTLDDRVTLDAVLRDPDGFIKGNPTPVILDEVQRAPDLLRAIKLAVDRNRQPGQYLLTGSANIMTLRTVSESLAGRVAIHELYPFCWSELVKKGNSNILNLLFASEDSKELIGKLSKTHVPDRREEIHNQILTGGYPVPALLMAKPQRYRWFDSYRQTYLERDLRNLSNIANLPEFNHLLTIASLRTGQLLNLSDLSREIKLPLTTLRRYTNLLETTYQIFLVYPYFANIGKRLVKTPKLYFNDTGIACFLGVVEDWEVLERQRRIGPLVETWIAAELKKLISMEEYPTRLYFWRTQTGQEVDFLVERGEKILAIEVKWSHKIDKSDISGLKSCAEALKEKVKFSIILYSGTEVIAFRPQYNSHAF